MTFFIIGMGEIGKFLYKKLKKKYNCGYFKSNKKKTNFKVEELIKKTIDYDIIIYSAGIATFKKCQNYKKLSNKINYEIPKKIIEKINNKKIFIYFSSTNTRCKKNLNNAYTIQKFKFEKDTLQTKKKIIVLRIGKLVNSLGVLSKWKKMVIRNKVIPIYHDLYFSPVTKIGIFNILLKIIKSKKFGIFNYSNIHQISYLELFKKKFSNYKNLKIISSKKFNKFHYQNMASQKDDKYFEKIKFPEIKDL